MVESLSHRIMKSPNAMSCRFKSHRGERGYVLLVLLLFVAMLSIGFFAAVRQLDFQVKRDREEEMIHRGVQYSRAIKAFYKKFGRYPTRIEDLENTNGMRFLRRRYKDPLNRDKATGKEKDFKLLHLTDVQSSFGPAQRGIVSAADLANQQAGAPGALNSARGGFGGNGPSSIPGKGDQQADPGSPQTGDQQAPDASEHANADQAASPDSNQATPPPPQPLSQQVGANGAPQVFGGGAVVGVASFSKEKSIREFNKKNHYNQWQFIYNPTLDRGGLLMTPDQPPLQGASQNLQQNNQNGVQNPSGLGSSGFGNGVGAGANPVAPQPSPQQPSPQQQNTQ